MLGETLRRFKACCSDYFWACSTKTAVPLSTGSDEETDFLNGGVDSDLDGFPVSQD